MRIVAVVLNYERAVNVPIVVESLQGGKIVPGEIIVIDNDPESDLQVEGVTLMRCGRNFGCSIRHALALVTDATHCLFVDDDLALGLNTLRDFVNWHARLPEAILGHFGMVVDHHRAEKPYSGGRRLPEPTDKPREVDVVLGRVHFCRVDKLAQAFTLLGKMTDYPHRQCDDILLSLANRLYGHKNYIVPTDSLSTTHNLPEFDIGLSREKGHYDLRNRATRLLLDLSEG